MELELRYKSVSSESFPSIRLNMPPRNIFDAHARTPRIRMRVCVYIYIHCTYTSYLLAWPQRHDDKFLPLIYEIAFIRVLVRVCQAVMGSEACMNKCTYVVQLSES